MSSHTTATVTNVLYHCLPARPASTTHQWTPTANTNAPTGRGIAIAVWTGEGLLIYGGSTGGTAAFNETYYYRPNRPSVAPHPAAEK